MYCLDVFNISFTIWIVNNNENYFQKKFLEGSKATKQE